MTQIPSFYDPTEGKLTEIKAAHLSLHKCAKQSKNFRKELNRVQEEFQFAKEDFSVYDSKFVKSKLKTAKWTRSRRSQVYDEMGLSQNSQSVNDLAR